MERDYY
ncbi:Protein of unknown function [Bacillus cereus]|nr:Protein of unknown function [Bacillus mobilis]SCN02742.1 Protein of unknown function [Bacillus cereus]